MLIALACALLAAAAPEAAAVAQSAAQSADQAEAGGLREAGQWLVQHGAVAIFVAFILCGIGLHLSEDFILIPAGIAVVGAGGAAADQVNWTLFTEFAVAAWAGIVLGDVGWVWICRHFGTRLMGSRRVRRFIGPRTLCEVKHQMDVRGAWALLVARFIPGARTPMITVSGLMHLAWWKILLVEMGGVVITAPAQMLIGVGVAKIGSQFESAAHRWMLYIGATLAVIVLMFVIHMVISRRAAKHRPPRAPVSWLHGFSIAKRFERRAPRLASAGVAR
jgi:membrane protein DedA with SNARE-associated domain